MAKGVCQVHDSLPAAGLQREGIATKLLGLLKVPEAQVDPWPSRAKRGAEKNGLWFLDFFPPPSPPPSSCSNKTTPAARKWHPACQVDQGPHHLWAKADRSFQLLGGLDSRRTELQGTSARSRQSKWGSRSTLRVAQSAHPFLALSLVPELFFGFPLKSKGYE